jgi:hypothetical protein
MGWFGMDRLPSRLDTNGRTCFRLRAFLFYSLNNVTLKTCNILGHILRCFANIAYNFHFKMYDIGVDSRGHNMNAIISCKR